MLTSLRSLPGKGSNRETEDWNDDEDDDDEEEEANLLSPLLSRCYGTYVHLACQERQQNERRFRAFQVVARLAHSLAFNLEIDCL